MRFDYKDINLVPKYSVVDSRSECDTSIQFGKHKFKNPVMPANMESVINEELAVKLATEGYFYVMHRFNVDNIEFTKMMKSKELITSISIGVNQDTYDYIDILIVKPDLVPDYITIDIAHGHCKKMKKMIKHIKTHFPDVFIIAGNVSTINATSDLDNWGADAIKVGIGPGCFIPSAKVKTLNGFKTLNDIEIGDMVNTHKNRYKKVTHKHKYQNKDILLKINDLEPSTPTHEYYVINKSDKNLVNETNLDNYVYWIQSQELDKDKHLLVKF